MSSACKRQCRSCAMFTPEVFDSVPQPVGRCLHVSFFKSGISRRGADGKLERLHADMTERLPPEQILEYNKQGYFWNDLVDLKSQVRYCNHWTSPLTFAAKALEYYGDSIDNYPWVDEKIKEWFEKGSPMVERFDDKFTRISALTYTTPTVPEEYADYNACLTCRHYKMELNEDASPKPFKGTCHKSDMQSKGGVFSIFEETEVLNTYSFFSCHAWSPSPRVNFKEDPIHLPSRLLMFVETNPIDISVEKYQDFLRMPTITKSRQVAQEEYERMLEVDLTGVLRIRHKQIDFNQFYADFKLGPVNKFFSAGLGRHTKELTEKWGKFGHYKDADSIYDIPDDMLNQPLDSGLEGDEDWARALQSAEGVPEDEEFVPPPVQAAGIPSD